MKTILLLSALIMSTSVFSLDKDPCEIKPGDPSCVVHIMSVYETNRPLGLEKAKKTCTKDNLFGCEVEKALEIANYNLSIQEGEKVEKPTSDIKIHRKYVKNLKTCNYGKKLMEVNKLPSIIAFRDKDNNCRFQVKRDGYYMSCNLNNKFRKQLLKTTDIVEMVMQFNGYRLADLCKFTLNEKNEHIKTKADIKALME